MKMDDNQKKNNNKITPFPSQEERETDKEFDALFKERLLSDADAYEKELNENPDLADVKAPDDLFERIVGELKEKNIWEEDDENVSNGDVEWINKKGELTKDEIYNLLSDEDRAALELGLKVQGRKKWRRVVKYGGTVASLFAVIFCISMYSAANRRYAMGIVNSLFESNLSIHMNGSGDIKESMIEGKDAYEQIYNQLNIKSPYFNYMPKGMKYMDYNINKNTNSASIFFEYKDTIFTIYMYNNFDETVANQIFDGEVKDNFCLEVNNCSVNVWELDSPDGKNAFVAQFDFEGVYYAIWGKVEKSEFVKMIENMS